MIRDQIVKAIEDAIGRKDVKLDAPEVESFGDYSTNIALRLKTPAGKIVVKLQKDKELKAIVEKIEVAGPGFINFHLKKEFLVGELERVGEDYGKSDLGRGKTVVVEYSSPNIAKRFSVGHLRSTIIGQALRNLYTFLGYKTIGENHLGDWGTQFGMVIAQVLRSNLDPKDLSVDEFQKLYVEFNNEAKGDEKRLGEARSWFKKLEGGDATAKKIWETAVETSMAEFDKIYGLLGIAIENRHGESFYEDKMQAVIKAARDKKISKKSKGAEIVQLKGLPPAMLLKSDGGTTYFTRDLAAIKYRVETWNPDLIIYEVGVEQTLHFKQVFAAAKLLGWGKGLELVHIGHGLFLFEGKKMSTRAGTDIKLGDVLAKAIDKAKELGNKEGTARAVGIGAIKYFDLLHHPTSDIDFSWKSIFNLSGNSGPYLQYTVARVSSVLAKAKGQKSKPKTSLKSSVPNEEELRVMHTLVKFPEVVVDAAVTYAPNLLCNYLYGLAQKFNTFYNKHRIINSENEKLRIRMTKATGIVLKNGLGLLGIEAPEKM